MKIKSIKLLILAIISIFGVTTLLVSPNSIAEGSDIKIDSLDACSSLKEGTVAYDAAGCNNNTTDKLPSVIQAILYTVIGISGLIAVVFIVIGGIQYMTSTGDPGKIKKARDTILYSLIGLVICVLAFAIVNWTITTVSNANNSSGGSNSSEESDDSDENSSIRKTSEIPIAFFKK